jgi:predicted flap endonuclease-1-like 5' DNA nuclease
VRFLIQSFLPALAAFGLGVLFHRLLWKKGTRVSSPITGSADRFAASEQVHKPEDNGDVMAERIAEIAALRAEHVRVLSERDARVKEFAVLTFEHFAMKTALAGRDMSLASLRAQQEVQQRTIEDLRNQLVAVTDDNAAALATLRADGNGRLAVLASEHDGALAALRVEHDRALQEAHGDRDRALSGLRSDHEKAVAELRRRAERAEDDLARVMAEREGCEAELARLRDELDTKGSEMPSSSAGAFDVASDEAFEDLGVLADDLLRIEGIGPKISEILMAGGIRTYGRLAAMPEERVRSIVHAGGVSFISSIGTWAAQAALLRDGDEAGFQALVDRLEAGHDDMR